MGLWVLKIIAICVYIDFTQLPNFLEMFRKVVYVLQAQCEPQQQLSKNAKPVSTRTRKHWFHIINSYAPGQTVARWWKVHRRRSKADNISFSPSLPWFFFFCCSPYLHPADFISLFFLINILGFSLFFPPKHKHRVKQWSCAPSTV